MDARAFKDKQRAAWSAAAAGWEKWVDLFEQGGHTMSSRMVDLAQVAAGSSVLDIASGPGDPGLVAADRVGPTGRVTLTDISADMIDVARRRAAKRGLDHVDFQVTDAEGVDCAGELYDAVTSRWGFMFFPDRPAAIAASKAALRPGGRFVAAVWAAPAKAPLIGVAPMTIMKALDLTPPPAGTPGVFALADPAPFVGELRAAGFSSVEVEEVEIAFPFDSAAMFVEFMRDIAAPFNAMLAGETEARRQEIWDLVATAVSDLADDNGALTTPNVSLVVSATA